MSKLEARRLLTLLDRRRIKSVHYLVSREDIRKEIGALLKPEKD
jgi:hypothetical protein